MDLDLEFVNYADDHAEADQQCRLLDFVDHIIARMKEGFADAA